MNSVSEYTFVTNSASGFVERNLMRGINLWSQSMFSSENKQKISFDYHQIISYLYILDLSKLKLQKKKKRLSCLNIHVSLEQLGWHCATFEVRKKSLV